MNNEDPIDKKSNKNPLDKKIPLLEIKDLEVEYVTSDGVVEALNHINLSIFEGETIGVVGETGAGKTTLAKSIMRLLQSPPSRTVQGEILYNGKDILKMSDSDMRKIRGKHISMIFQDPMTSLNPVMPVGEQIAEAIQTHEKLSKVEATHRSLEMLELVGIHANRSENYPHEFSGGMKQRVVIAIALSCNPKLLIADEPTTALDVTIQAQVLEMMQDLKEKLQTAILLITHDLGVVAQTCQKVAVIYAGNIVEYGNVFEIFKDMRHPYTIGLMNSIPKIADDVKRLEPIKGLMPDPMDLPPGCAFYDRCDYRFDICKDRRPSPVYIPNSGHYITCFYVEKQLQEG